MTPEQLVQAVNKAQAEHNYDECVKLLSEIIAKQPRNTDAFNNRGLAYADLKQFEKAIQDYNQAIELNPKDARAFNNRGVVYADLKQFEKAIQNYNQTIELNPKYVSAFNNRGIAHQKLGKEKKAIEDFKKAQELDPSIIANEKIKALEKEFAERIAQTQESNTKVQGFQGILEGLEAEHKTEEENWFKWSQWAVFITLGLIVLVIILIACNIFESHDTYIVYIFSSIVTFAVIRQYTNAKALRIEASNRVAMAKMFERVKNENNEYQQEFLPKLSDAIVYSTIKAKNNSDGLVEKIINVLEKIKK